MKRDLQLSTPRQTTTDFADLNRPWGERWSALASSFDERASPEARDFTAAADPVDMVLRAWRQRQDPAESILLYPRLTITFADALDRMPTETLAFAWAVVEAARLKCLLGGGVHWLVEARSQLDNRRLAPLGPSRLQAIKALLETYYADELRVLGQVDEATRRLADAMRSVPEEELVLRSRVLEIASTFAAEAAEEPGQETRARSLLVEAEKLAQAHPRIPGRLAEIRLRQARLLVDQRRFYDARGLLLSARDDLPPDRDFRLALEIHHDLLHTYVARDELDRAENLLEKTRQLYDHEVGDHLLRAERDRLEGRVVLRRGREAEAPRLLENALRVFLRHYRHHDALATLPDLFSAWRHEGLGDDHTRRGLDLIARFQSSPGFDRLGPERIQPLFAFAAGLGVGLDLDDPILWHLEAETIEHVH